MYKQNCNIKVHIGNRFFNYINKSVYNRGIQNNYLGEDKKMTYSELNQPILFIVVFILASVALFQTITMMRRAWRRAIGLGLTNAEVRKGLVTGITISIIPAVSTFVVFLAIAQFMGNPFTWMRMFIVGGNAFELMAASQGIESAGEQMVVGGYTASGWVHGVYVACLAAASCCIWTVLANKPISKIFEKAEKFDVRLVIIIGVGCLMGVMGYATVNFGLGDISTKGVIFLASFILGAILVWISNRKPNLTWLAEFTMPICLVFGMAVACVIF